MKRKSIALLICYIGELPWYFHYFVHTCRFNPTVDFILITNDTKNYDSHLPSNLKLIVMQLDEINELATAKLGFKVKISNGYKLCDFKPAYGLLFSELIKGFDFWGHGDLDMIFGDIREFMTEELLETYDLVSVRHDFLTGQFLLFRNNYKMNSMFQLSKDYQRVMESDQHHCFDETNFQWDGFREGKDYTEIPSDMESMTHLVKRLEAEKYIKPHFDFLIIEGVPGRLAWDRGKLFYKNKYEVLLYHMVLFKKVYAPIKPVKVIPLKFNISPTRIYHC